MIYLFTFKSLDDPNASPLDYYVRGEHQARARLVGMACMSPTITEADLIMRKQPEVKAVLEFEDQQDRDLWIRDHADMSITIEWHGYRANVIEADLVRH